MKPYAFGIDIGGTSVKIGLFRSSGDLLRSFEIPTRRQEEGRHILPDIGRFLSETAEGENIKGEDLEGIGIAVPGPVLEGHIVNRCVNLGWGVMDVTRELSDLLSETPLSAIGEDRIRLANDANAAALGEMWRGGGMGRQELVMVTLGTGVGGGIIHKGEIVEGSFGSAGEIGHMVLNTREERICGCGKRGHTEQYASATGIVWRAKKLLEEREERSLLREIKEPTAKDIFTLAKEGDVLAMEAVELSAEVIGRTCALVSCVFDPQIYVIGGGVSKAGDFLLSAVRKYFGEYAFHASKDAEFSLATLGNDAGMYGAVRMLLGKE